MGQKQFPDLWWNTPLELATVRRPPDLFDVESANPGQLTGDIAPEQDADLKLKQFAFQAYLEARQSADLRRDLAATLRASTAPFNIGGEVWYIEQDLSRMSSGKWLRKNTVDRSNRRSFAGACRRGHQGVQVQRNESEKGSR